MTRSILRSVAREARFLMVRSATALSEKRVLCGIDVVNMGDQHQSESVFAKVNLALEAIRKAAPWRLGTIRRGLQRILIVRQPGSSYCGFVQACALSDTTLEHQRPEWVASVILHEAIHARFAGRGIKYEACRTRIEEICFKHQLLLLARMPNTQDLAEHLFSTGTDNGTPMQPGIKSQ